MGKKQRSKKEWTYESLHEEAQEIISRWPKWKRELSGGYKEKNKKKKEWTNESLNEEMYDLIVRWREWVLNLSWGITSYEYMDLPQRLYDILKYARSVGEGTYYELANKANENCKIDFRHIRKYHKEHAIHLSAIFCHQEITTKQAKILIEDEVGRLRKMLERQYEKFSSIGYHKNT